MSILCFHIHGLLSVHCLQAIGDIGELWHTHDHVCASRRAFALLEALAKLKECNIVLGDLRPPSIFFVGSFTEKSGL